MAALGLGAASDVTEVEPLSGGVASDIARVRVGGRDYCMKFALPKLRVAEDWFAPVHRNLAEYAWLEVAAAIEPRGAVKLFGRSQEAHGFAMEFLAGDEVRLWKAELLGGRVEPGRAARVADLLGRIHAASARPGFDRSPFANRDDFRALRIEPYLSFTAGRYPALSEALTRMAGELYAADQVLVHGDVSPKNIFFRDESPVILDAECATMGCASFDPGFCLNHLFLKAVHLPEKREALVAEARAFWAAYSAQVDFEPAAELEARVCRLLPALMLARVDGKSPVEYLSETARRAVRGIAVPLIGSPADSLAAFAARFEATLKEFAT